MQLLFQGDIGILSFGEFFIQKKITAELCFFIQPHNEEITKPIQVEDLWPLALENLVAEKTKFGRIGVFFDRWTDFPQDLAIDFSAYKPRDKRAEKTPHIRFFPTQILKIMAEEGFGGSSEFRRLARKFLRLAKNTHRDTIFFADPIFGHSQIKKTLQNLAGTQIQIFTVVDFLPLWLEKNISDFRVDGIAPSKIFPKISIKFPETSKENSLFFHTQAEKILRTKLGTQNFT